MEDIAAAVGVSVRTLFRYMATKEEMLLGPMAATGAILAGWIRDAEVGATAWDALIDVVSRFAADLVSEGERAKARSRLVVMTPQLRGGLSDKRRLWMDEMSPAVQERLSGSQDAAVIARAMVASALAALDVTAEHWAFADRAIDLPSLFRRAADAVRRLACYLTSAVPLGVFCRCCPVCRRDSGRPPRHHRRVPPTELDDDDGGGRGFQYGVGWGWRRRRWRRSGAGAAGRVPPGAVRVPGQAAGCAVGDVRCPAVQAGPGAHAGGAVAGAGVPPRSRRGV